MKPLKRLWWFLLVLPLTVFVVIAVRPRRHPFTVPQGLHATKVNVIHHRVLHPIWVYQFTDNPKLVQSRLEQHLTIDGWKVDPESPDGFLNFTRGADADVAAFECRKKAWTGVDPAVTCQITVFEEPSWLGGIWDDIKYRYRL
jgi:hypothetical protein